MPDPEKPNRETHLTHPCPCRLTYGVTRAPAGEARAAVCTRHDRGVRRVHAVVRQTASAVRSVHERGPTSSSAGAERRAGCRIEMCSPGPSRQGRDQYSATTEYCPGLTIPSSSHTFVTTTGPC